MNFASCWTKQAEALLLELVQRERRIVDIATALGKSRNSVIGKLQRMKAKGVTIESNWYGKTGRPQTAAERRVRKPPEPRPAPKPKSVPASVFGSRPPDPWQRHVAPVLEMRRVGLMELGDRMCRWPLGEPGKPGFCFCGNDTEPERSYCPPHHRYAHG